MTAFQLYLYGASRGPIDSSFEEAEERLTALPRLHFEPDGSFVWNLEGAEQQVFGMVYDAAGSIQYCDLQGDCRLESWKQLCRAISGGNLNNLEVLLLPDQQLQDLQTFEETHWPEDSATAPKNS